MKYKIKWKTFNSDIGEYVKTEIFDDVQWKDYGVRATIDEPKFTLIIPYTSIYDIDILYY